MSASDPKRTWYCIALVSHSAVLLGQPDLCDYLSEFDQIAERVCEEGKLAADGVELERLCHDLGTAGSKVSNGPLDIRHVDTEVVIAGIAETIAQVRVDGSVNRQRISSTQQFDQKGVVIRGG